MGESTAKYVIGLLDGENRDWIEILNTMRVSVSGLPSGYEPMRAVTGEEGNQFNPAGGEVGVQPSGQSARSWRVSTSS
jgi:hypothetical protein